MTDFSLSPSGAKVPGLSEDDRRLGHLIRRGEEAGDGDVLVSIVGFPCDLGVERNGGRVGAAQGPSAIRSQLFKLTPDATFPAHRRLLERSVDLGDLISESLGPGSAATSPQRTRGGSRGGQDLDPLAQWQAHLGRVVAGEISRGRVVVVLGGGHETAYGHFLGYVESEGPVEMVNVDAHADVRPLLSDDVGNPGSWGHSGSPFRQALEHESGALQRYRVVGLQRSAVAESHVRYLEESGAQWRWSHEFDVGAFCESLDSAQAPILVTLDLDVVDQSEAPGVSAPATLGLSGRELIACAETAGRHRNVTSLDVVELCPRFDPDARTARLAARCVWSFLRGLAERLAAEL